MNKIISSICVYIIVFFFFFEQIFLLHKWKIVVKYLEKNRINSTSIFRNKNVRNNLLQKFYLSTYYLYY